MLRSQQAQQWKNIGRALSSFHLAHLVSEHKFAQQTKTKQKGGFVRDLSTMFTKTCFKCLQVKEIKDDKQQMSMYMHMTISGHVRA